jgi:DNA-binding NarL/FixJ family response regulator
MSPLPVEKLTSHQIRVLNAMARHGDLHHAALDLQLSKATISYHLAVARHVLGMPNRVKMLLEWANQHN